MARQWIVRKGTFDSGHRVMNEKMKCFNLHGHTYLYELIFEFNQMENIGYAIDFKEIKRVACQWIDDLLDHGFIANPKDYKYIDAVKYEKGKLWEMSLNGEGVYCNPTVENIAKEIYLAMELLFGQYSDLRIFQIKLHETPNCLTLCTPESITKQERVNWRAANGIGIKLYAEEKGILNYDDRKD